MPSILPARLPGLRTAVAALAAVLLVLGLASAPPAHADSSVPPTLTDGFGLTQVAPATGTATNFVLTVTTPEVAGQHHIRILLPPDYATDTTKRYPVFYFLHGASDDPADPGLAYPALVAATSMITVIPDGGLRGWYTDWLDQNTAAGAQNWETFHLTQVIPFIDANLRTIATQHERAIGGLSMGGFGALHYAQDRPDLFSQVVTLSGADDLSGDEAIIRAAVVAMLTNVGAALCAPSTPAGGCGLDFGPSVSSDAIWGTPYPVFNADWRWNAADPSNHMDKLAGIGISLYTGNGAGNPADEEFWAESASQHVKDHLDALGYPYYYVNYGDGTGWGTDCHGGHTATCWAQDLVDYVPRLEAAFATP
jgi:S-formylglutathione hydrolase FrmB